MKAHLGFWKFVQSITDAKEAHAVAFARNRNGDEHKETMWLKRRAGLRMRARWEALPDTDRQRWMQENPDPAWTWDLSKGVIDDRTRVAKQNLQKTSDVEPAPSDEVLSPQTSVAEPALPASVAELKTVRNGYIRASRHASISRMQIASRQTDSPRLLGGMMSLLASVGASILVDLPPRQQDDASLKLCDGLAAINGILGGATTQDDDELREQAEAAEGALMRFSARYAKVAGVAIAECDAAGLPNPDPPLLEKWFKRPRPIIPGDLPVSDPHPTDETSPPMHPASSTSTQATKNKRTRVNSASSCVSDDVDDSSGGIASRIQKRGRSAAAAAKYRIGEVLEVEAEMRRAQRVTETAEYASESEHSNTHSRPRRSSDGGAEDNMDDAFHIEEGTKSDDGCGDNNEGVEEDASGDDASSEGGSGSSLPEDEDEENAVPPTQITDPLATWETARMGLPGFVQ